MIEMTFSKGTTFMIYLAMRINKIELISLGAGYLEQRNKKCNKNARLNDSVHQFAPNV
jgi:hypothetical protein